MSTLGMISEEKIGKYCVIDTAYHVPIKTLSATDLETHMQRLTMAPLDMGFGTQGFSAFKISQTHLSVPRFYGQQQFGAAGQNDCSLGESMQHSFSGSVSEIQAEALGAIRTREEAGVEGARGGILVLPCGFGKTIAALKYICDRGRRAIVLVCKSFLVEQWTRQINKFIPSATVGTIQRDVFISGDVTIAMVQSLCAREYDSTRMREFGTVVIDEAHHHAARYFSQALWCIPSTYVLALSATPERKDGLTQLLVWSMGPINFRAERKNQEPVRINVVLYEQGVSSEMRTRDGSVNMAGMTNRLCEDATRTQLLCKCIAGRYVEGRCNLVLSDRLAHLEAIRSLLLQRSDVDGADIGWYVGNTKKAARAETEQFSRIILSTYSMAKEGLDIVRLDTLTMCTPKSDIEQCVGRIQRPSADKKPPVVDDIVDPFSIFSGMRYKRAAFYRKQNYSCMHSVRPQRDNFSSLQ